MIFSQTSWRTVCLVMLLTIGQAALLYHVVQPHHEHSTANANNTSRIECAIDDYLASSVSHPHLSIPCSFWKWATYVFPSQFISPYLPQALVARGPPLLSVV